MQGMVGKEAPGAEAVGFRKLALVMVDSPYIALNPGVFGNEVALRKVSVLKD